MTTSTPSPLEVVGDVAGEFITELQEGYRRDEAGAVARLARLRRGAGRSPQDAPELWGETGAERLYEKLPDPLAVRAAPALFLAVTLYALHQQSRLTERMHQPGVDLGEAVRRLMPGPGIDEPIRRRFVRAGLATTFETRAYRLRELVSLLRRDSIPLDYVRLTRQLYRARTSVGLREVRQDWGHSFNSYRPTADDNADKEV